MFKEIFFLFKWQVLFVPFVEKTGSFDFFICKKSCRRLTISTFFAWIIFSFLDFFYPGFLLQFSE